MNNIKNIFQIVLVIAATIIMFVFVSSCYAVTVTTSKDVELGCCQDYPAHPTTHVETGRLDTQLSVTLVLLQKPGLIC